MWGSRFFTSRHFTSRYWDATGAAGAASDLSGVAQLAGAYSTKLKGARSHQLTASYSMKITGG